MNSSETLFKPSLGRTYVQIQKNEWTMNLTQWFNHSTFMSSAPVDYLDGGWYPRLSNTARINVVHVVDFSK